MESSVSIRTAENGIIVRYDDPKVRAKNHEKDSEWQDPEVELVFATAKEAMPKVQEILKMMMGEENSASDEYESAFNEASSNE